MLYLTLGIIIQVLPDLLHVCQLCVHTSVHSEISELASTVPVLPLEHVPDRCSPVLDSHVPCEVVLCHRGYAVSIHHLQVH